MKQTVIIVLLMMVFVIPSFANESKDNKSSQSIGFEFHHTFGDTSTVHRAPMYVNIKAYYDAETNKISIIYDGEKSGEVFLYLNGNVIDYDSELNTSFQISECGLYKIEIISDSWIAEGFLRL